MKIKLKYAVLAAFALLLLAIPEKNALATEEIKANQLVNIGTSTNVYESPDESSQPVGEFGIGMAVISQEEPADGWVKVKYKDIEGYIKISAIEGQDASGLDQEFENVSNDNLLIFEKMEYEKSQQTQKIIWGIIIGGLVVAMFAIGIITGLNKKKENK
jgi:hypothetical protein